MDVKTAIMKGDAEALRQCLAEDSSCADELIEWGNKKKCVTHPLHFVSDMLFNGTLPKGKELPLANSVERHPPETSGVGVTWQRVQ